MKNIFLILSKMIKWIHKYVCINTNLFTKNSLIQDQAQHSFIYSNQKKDEDNFLNGKMFW